MMTPQVSLLSGDPTPWPQTVRHAPLSCEIPPRYGNESTADYRVRSLRWRAWAAAKLPDLWFATDDEVAKFRQWLRSVVSS